MSALEHAARPFWRSLYRNVVRECKRLPDATTSLHFLSRARATFRSRDANFEQEEHILKQLQAANAGYLHALTRCLEQAHARRGKLKRSRIERILREARDSRVPPLKPGYPRTRPPVYPPRLQAYLTSSDSYTKGRAPSPEQLLKPPKLPARADPNSEEARLLGRLHVRREANIKWRYLADLRSRLYAPMTRAEAQRVHELATTEQSRPCKHKAPEEAILQEFKENERRSRKTSDWDRPKHITSRFMRRRYAALLAKGVILEPKEDTTGGQVQWTARRPDVALGVAKKAVAATDEDQAWTAPPLAKGK